MTDDLLAGDALNRLVRTRHGCMLHNRNDSVVGRSIAYYGEYYESEVRIFQMLLRPGDIAVDAGANIGPHTLAMANAVGPNGRVLAVEPMRLTHQLLCANVALNSLLNVDCFHGALSDADGVLGVADIDATTEQNFGGVSLRDIPGKIEISVCRLDDMFRRDRLRLMKIDVEGMEAAVLRGSRQTIEDFRPVLYVENDRPGQSRELLSVLSDLSYSCYWHLATFHNPANYNGQTEPMHPCGFIDQGAHFASIGFAVNMLCLPSEAGVSIDWLPPVLSIDEHPFEKKWNGRFRSDGNDATVS